MMLKKRCIMNLQIARTLKELRDHYKMNQDEVSQKLNISRQAYSSYERGKRVPSLEMAVQMALLFHVTLDQLIFGLHQKTDPFAKLPSNYQELLKGYTNLSVENQQQAIKYIHFLEQEN